MPTEYVIQKRGLQVWQYVTWYSDKDQARENFRKLSAGQGYSYRLVELNVLEQVLLGGEREDNPPQVEAVEAVKSSGWSDKNYPSFSSTPSFNRDDEIKPSGRGAHFVGTVWVCNKELKQKKRMPEAEAVKLLVQPGWFKGGPRTIV